MPDRRNADVDDEALQIARQMIAEREIDGLKQGQTRIEQSLGEVKNSIASLNQSLAVHKVQTGFIGFLVAAVVSAVAAFVQFMLKGSH